MRERALRADQLPGGSDVSPAQRGALGDGFVHGAAAGRRPRFISVCAGIGGFDAGLERAGWECVAQVEIDPFVNRVRAKHWPGVRQHGDLITFRGERGAAELVCGGTPCQDLSVAGKRAGLDGSRSQLFYEFIRVADECDADVLFENVPGLLSSGTCPECAERRNRKEPGVPGHDHRGEDFALVIREITGFHPAVPADGWRNSGVAVGPKRFLAWRVLDARHFGVPQRRRRVFVVGSAGAERALSLFPECPCCGWDSPAGGEARSGTADEITGGVAGTLQARGNRLGADEAGGGLSKSLRSGQRGTDDPDRTTYIPEFAEDDVMETLSSNPRNRSNSNGPIVVESVALRGRDGGATAELGGDTAHAVRSSQGHGDKGHVLIAAPLTAGLAPSGMAGRRKEDDENLVAHTLSATYGKSVDHAGTKGTGPKNVHIEASSVRRLTPTECERLMAFPDGWTAVDGEGEYELKRDGTWRLVSGTPDGPRYAALGNSIVTNVAEWVGRQMLGAPQSDHAPQSPSPAPSRSEKDGIHGSTHLSKRTGLHNA